MERWICEGIERWRDGEMGTGMVKAIVLMHDESTSDDCYGGNILSLFREKYRAKCSRR